LKEKQTGMKKQVSIDFIVEDPGLYRIAWKDFRTGRSGCSLQLLLGASRGIGARAQQPIS